jgi:hypothetical protein
LTRASAEIGILAKEAATDRDTARSRHGYIINYAGCPLLWKSQMQTEVALSSTESKYTGLSYALRDAISVMELLKEMKSRGYPILKTQARVHCRVFEDNSGALEMAQVHSDGMVNLRQYVGSEKECDDTGMYRTVRSAYPTYRERESTRIDQIVDPIARDSETRFNSCLGLKRPE